MPAPGRLASVLLLLGAGCLAPGPSAPDLAAAPADLAADAHTAPPDLADPRAAPTFDRGALVRGPRHQRRLALVYTGGSFADGGTKILDELKAHGAGGSFFLTGDFCRYAAFQPLVARMHREGHYVGAHSDKHLLYASWDSPPKLLVTRAQFDDDLTRNLIELEALGIPRAQAPVFLPPYEHHTQEIADWTVARGMVLVGFTPGTRSSADYLPDTDPGFISAPEIVKTILKKEETDPDGLNGFLLLMHLGATPERTVDRLHDHLGALMDELGRRGYRFVRVDALLGGASP